MPFVSVIIPTYRDYDKLRYCIDALTQQTYPSDKFEVIVIDNNTDETFVSRENLSFPASVRIERERKPGSYAARNKGLAVAKGDIIAFTDSDCIPDASWIENGVAALASQPHPSIVGGRVEFRFRGASPSTAELYDSLFSINQKHFIENAGFAATANLFTSKEVFQKTGGFSELHYSGGDFEWCRRAVTLGASLFFADQAIVFHPARRSIRKIILRARRIVGGIYINHNGKAKKYLDYLRYMQSDTRYRFNRLQKITGISPSQKRRILFLECIVHSVRIFEMIRLRLGGRAMRD
ncbi:MAG: glycosyltransferase family A protein [Patescibacteria group bacterium]